MSGTFYKEQISLQGELSEYNNSDNSYELDCDEEYKVTKYNDYILVYSRRSYAHARYLAIEEYKKYVAAQLKVLDEEQTRLEKTFLL